MVPVWHKLVAQHSWLKQAFEIAVFVFAAWLLNWFARSAVRRWTPKLAPSLHRSLTMVFNRVITPLLVLGVVTLSIHLFPVPSRILAVIHKVLYLGLLALVLYYLFRVAQLFVDRWLEANAGSRSLREPVRFAVRVAFLAFATMILLENLGVSLTAVWTTLGVGSVAVALALQDTLSNFFAGIYLRLDNPVRLDDYIKLESGEEGFVIEFGWRSVRIRTLPNNVVVVPNSKLASTIVTNYSLPEPEMSLLLPVRASYNSDPDQVEQILVEEGRKAAGEIPGLLAQPAPFVRLIPGFGESWFDFTLICRVDSFANQYLVQHELRKRIVKRFRQEGIEIPYPQRGIHLRSQQTRIPGATAS